MKPLLTDRQASILDFILEYISHNGMPPTRGEIYRKFDFKSPNAAQEHLKALEKKGYITMQSFLARSIKVLP